MTTSSKPSSEFPIGFGHPELTKEPLDDLGTVEIRTHTGAVYAFPDMSLKALKAVLPESGRTPGSQPTLMIMNISASLLSVPFCIIDQVSCGSTCLWSSKEIQ
jgi:hypothetical protein